MRINDLSLDEKWISEADSPLRKKDDISLSDGLFYRKVTDDEGQTPQKSGREINRFSLLNEPTGCEKGKKSVDQLAHLFWALCAKCLFGS